jgi:hypothetical protein
LPTVGSSVRKSTVIVRESSGCSTARRASASARLVAEAGDVAQHVVQRHQRETEREAAEREAQ